MRVWLVTVSDVGNDSHMLLSAGRLTCEGGACACQVPVAPSPLASTAAAPTARAGLISRFSPHQCHLTSRVDNQISELAKRIRSGSHNCETVHVVMQT